MGNLSTTAAYFKIAVKWLVLALAAMGLLWILWLVIFFVFGLLFPPTPTGADNAFGSLPIPFQVTNTNLAAINFDLEVAGGLSNSTQIIPVYAIPSSKAQLSSLENAKKKAKTAGLDSDPEKISDSQWRWSAKKNPNKILTINIINNNFHFLYDWKKDPSALEGVFKTTDADKVKEARNYLRKFGGLTVDLTKSDTKITYLKIDGDQKNIVGSYSEANSVAISIYRDKVNGKYSAVEADKNRPQIEVTLSASPNSEKQLLEITYTYWTVDFKNQGTYQTLSTKTAFEDLKAGKALQTEGNDQTFATVTVSKVYLAYFNPTNYSRFLQPVYVFEGYGIVNNEQKNFTALVTALNPT